jgi:hypothetical protein
VNLNDLDLTKHKSYETHPDYLAGLKRTLDAAPKTSEDWDEMEALIKIRNRRMMEAGELSKNMEYPI